jgi:glycosyltransferase involved in cell wall biosynthesis
MNFLIIGPLPTNPNVPWNGNVLPIKLMIEDLEKEHTISIINLGREDNMEGFSFRRLFDIMSKIQRIPTLKKEADVIYLSLAESRLGNLRDLLIYCLCFNKLDKMVVQMLGGANIKKLLTPGLSVFYYLNKFFIRKFKGVIVEGQAQADSFTNVTDKNKIHIIPNFAQDYLFADEIKIEKKFSDLSEINILFLSNMLYGKGHQELIDAYLSLPDDLQKRIKIDFAGGFGDEHEKNTFLPKIEGLPNVKYHGMVKGDFKKELFHKAHIFCLPTYYPYEGQPFSIIESYAAGCVVITTNHSGIGYIFKDGKNGYEVIKKDVLNLKNTIKSLLLAEQKHKKIGLYNFKYAREIHTENRYLGLIKGVLLRDMP